MAPLQRARDLLLNHPILIAYTLLSAYCSFTLFVAGMVLIGRYGALAGVAPIVAGFGVHLLAWRAGRAVIGDQ